MLLPPWLLYHEAGLTPATILSTRILKMTMRVETPASEATRFSMRRDPWWVPLLLLFGGTRGRSYVELAGDRLVARFGWLFHRTFLLNDIEGARRRSWPWLYGIGWRSNFINLIGLIGSRGNVVEMRFKRRQRMWLLLPVSINRLAVSLEDPEAFLDTLAKAGVPVSRHS